MKDINNMTDQEILSLTEEDIERMIKFKVMERGIKLMKEPKAPDLIPIEDPKDIAYNIPVMGGFLFKDKDEAEELLETLRGFHSLVEVTKDWTLCDFYHTMKDPSFSLYEDRFYVKAVKVYTSEEYDVVSNKIRNNNTVKNIYKKEFDEYNDYLNSIADIIKSVRGRAEEIKAKYAELERLSHKFAIEYMTATKGDEDVAMRFFDKAYSLSDDDKSFILDNYHKYLTGEGDGTKADDAGGNADTEANLLPQN